MQTDHDAFAAYFEDWREGDPVPDGWHLVQYGDEPEWEYRTPGCTSGFKHLRGYHFEALTGLLAVELAKKGVHIIKQDDIFIVKGPGLFLPGFPTYLCVLVAGWRVVRDA